MTATRNDPVDLSVIIPVHNRSDLLGPTLLSLDRQTLANDRFEVIVVDDGSDPPLAVGPVRTLRNDVACGAAAARNRGAEQATGRVLLFLDAECVAHPGLLEAHLRAHHRQPAAYCSNTAGRELTPDQWAVRFGSGWDFADTVSLFERVEQTPGLLDPLVDLLAEPDPSDWVYFWTTAASVPAKAFEKAGGFSVDFEVKGVEDMELGYRLAQAGTPTFFLPDARCFHQPHERRRSMEVRRDRRNDHIMLVTHPDPVVETVVGFGIPAARSLTAPLAGFRQRLAPASADCARLGDLSKVVDTLRTCGESLLLGHPDHWPATLARASQIVLPSDDPDADVDQRLLGVRLPFGNGTFSVGIVTDYWRHFPERTQARIFDELLRTCHDVIVLAHVSTAPSAEADHGLVEALELFDRPYWESAVRLRREWHDFAFESLDAAFGALAVRLRGRDSPGPDLTTVLAEPTDSTTAAEPKG
jgi:glycosyltransferase involved in cell wall biosynthesis